MKSLDRSWDTENWIQWSNIVDLRYIGPEDSLNQAPDKKLGAMVAWFARTRYYSPVDGWRIQVSAKNCRMHRHPQYG